MSGAPFLMTPVWRSSPSLCWTVWPNCRWTWFLRSFLAWFWWEEGRTWGGWRRGWTRSVRACCLQTLALLDFVLRSGKESTWCRAAARGRGFVLLIERDSRKTHWNRKSGHMGSDGEILSCNVFSTNNPIFCSPCTPCLDELASFSPVHNALLLS